MRDQLRFSNDGGNIVNPRIHRIYLVAATLECRCKGDSTRNVCSCGIFTLRPGRVLRYWNVLPRELCIEIFR